MNQFTGHFWAWNWVGIAHARFIVRGVRLSSSCLESQIPMLSGFEQTRSYKLLLIANLSNFGELCNLSLGKQQVNVYINEIPMTLMIERSVAPWRCETACGRKHIHSMTLKTQISLFTRKCQGDKVTQCEGYYNHFNTIALKSPVCGDFTQGRTIISMTIFKSHLLFLWTLYCLNICTCPWET